MFDFSGLTEFVSHQENVTPYSPPSYPRNLLKALVSSGLDPNGFTGLSAKDMTTVLSNYGVDTVNFLGGHSEELVNTIKMSE